MEKNIKDYLHLYIGQLAILSGLTQAMIAYGWEEGQVRITGYLIDCLDKGGNFEIKPFLRPLSSMTEEEITNLVRLLLRKEDVHVIIDRSEDRDFIIAKYNTVYPESEYDKKRFDKLEMCLTISNINHPFCLQNNWMYIKGNGTGSTNEQLFNCHEITRYLLSKGFDLFNLIPEGLALDSDTLNPVKK